MKTKYVDRLLNEQPRDTLCNHLVPLKPLQDREPAIVGIDTEYLSAPPHTQLTWQFSYQGKTHIAFIKRGKLWSFRQLVDYVRILYKIPRETHLILVSFWSNAEIMNISDWQDYEIRQLHPNGVSNVILRNRERKEYAELYDIWHFFGPGYSLDKVAKSYGYKKYEYDTTNVTKASLKDPVFLEYAAHDPVLCELIFRDLREAFLELGADICVNKTAASASMSAFRRNWLKAPIMPPHRRVRKAALFANHGGRAEQYVLTYDGPLNEYDANSLYPNSVLAVGAFPLPTEWKQTHDLDVLRNALGGFGIFRFVYPMGTRYPCMPVDHEKIGLVFPLAGISDCSLYEAMYALEQGATIKPISVYYFDKASSTEYTDFIRDLIKIKQDANDSGNAGMRAAAKLAMNSGIGKMIQTKGGVSISELKQWGIENGMTLRQCLDPSIRSPKLELFKQEHQLRIGGSFYPEWHTLILGKSRAIMAKFLDAIQPFTISTDGCIAPARDTLPVIEGVHFEPKHSTNADGMRFVRERVGYLSANGEPIDIKHHSIHTPNKAEQFALINGDVESYTRARLVSLKDVAGGRSAPLSREESTMSFARFGSRKRKWIGNHSEPWNTIEEIPEFSAIVDAW